MSLLSADESSEFAARIARETRGLVFQTLTPCLNASDAGTVSNRNTPDQVEAEERPSSGLLAPRSCITSSFTSSQVDGSRSSGTLPNMNPASVDSEGKIHRCPHSACLFKSKQKRNMTTHIRAVQEKDKRFACTHPGCGFKTARSYSLLSHRQIHAPPQHVCLHPGCGYRGRRAASLMIHVQSVHEKKWLACKYKDCVCQTGWLRGLRQHIKDVHEGKAVFACDHHGCSYKGKRRVRLKIQKIKN